MFSLGIISSLLLFIISIYKEKRRYLITKKSFNYPPFLFEERRKQEENSKADN